MQRTLKHALIRYIERLEHDFLSLNLSLIRSKGAEVRTLNAMKKSITRLCSTLTTLPASYELSPVQVRHDIYNQLFVVGGFAHLLLHKSPDILDAANVTALRKILVTLRSVQDVFETDKLLNTLSA